MGAPPGPTAIRRKASTSMGGTKISVEALVAGVMPNLSGMRVRGVLMAAFTARFGKSCLMLS